MSVLRGYNFKKAAIMEIRYFQIIVPLFALILIVRQIRALSQNKSGVFETFVISFFGWVSLWSPSFQILFQMELQKYLA